MDQPEATQISYSILGLLAMWGPLSGYDLKRLFDHLLASMWGAAQSQIYKELRQMKGFGWVDMQREEQESRPDRKLYSITEQGQAALQQWQAQPPEILQIRDEMLLKVLFGTFAAPGDLVQNLRTSIASHETNLLAYRQNAAFLPMSGAFPQANKRPNPYKTESAEDPYMRLIVQFAIEFEKTYLRWLYETVDSIEHPEKQASLED